MTMAAIGATTPPKMTSKSFSIYGAQINSKLIPGLEAIVDASNYRAQNTLNKAADANMLG